MLKFNVEDILVLPQLKNGKFTKNIQPVDIQELVAEVTDILSYQSETKNIKVSSNFFGFPESPIQV